MRSDELPPRVGFPAHSLSSVEHAALLTAERGGTPFIAHRDAHGDLRIVPLAGTDRVRIGRTADNDVVLSGDPEVSRSHAVLEAAGAGWRLVDDRSRNGTFVNGERVTGHRRIDDRDVVRIGATAVLFRVPSGRAGIRPLSPSERGVLAALCRPLLEPGLVAVPASDQEIAAALMLSPAGVHRHVAALIAKVGVDALPENRRRAELARRAVELGLVSARDLDAVQ